MLSSVRRLLILSLCLASTVLTVVSGGSTAHAAADLTVIVVRDATPANCTQTYSTRVGTTFVPTRKIHCPAGTILEAVKIPLSEAKAKHEAYVVVPSRSSSSTEQAKASQQIQHLQDAANAQWHPGNTPLTTASSCATAQHSLETSWYISWDSKTTFNSWVHWDTHTDCTIYIWDSAMQGTNINSFVWWGHDQYADWGGNAGCRELTQGLMDWQPNVTKNPGYYYEQFLYDGSACNSGFPNYNNKTWTNVGPLS